MLKYKNNMRFVPKKCISCRSYWQAECNQLQLNYTITWNFMLKV